MLYVKRHLATLLILLFALLAIALVCWVFEKRLKHLDSHRKIASILLQSHHPVPHSIFHPL